VLQPRTHSQSIPKPSSHRFQPSTPSKKVTNRLMENHLKLAALLGASSVALGAFGAHGLQSRMTGMDQAIAAKHLNNWKTASSYQLAHAVLLVALASRSDVKPLSRNLLALGTICFSGSIYGLVLSSVSGNTMRLLGPITPLGGAMLVAGWASLLLN